MTEPTKGLTLYEANALKEARNLLVRKPEVVMRYLSGQVGEDNKGLIALALSAQLNHSKMQLESMTLCKVLAEHVIKLNTGVKDGTQATGDSGTFTSVVEAPAAVQASILEGAKASNQTGEQA